MFLALAVVDLGWEIVKVNAAGPDPGTWPWRFTLLDTSTCAAIAALLIGIIVTRSQLSQTLQPVLSWSAFAGDSREVPDSLRTVMVANAGGGRAIVRRVSYRIRTMPAHAGVADVSADWMSWHAAISAFMALDLSLDRDRDIFLRHLGAGAAVPMVSRTRDGMELLALGPKAVEKLSVLDIRIQVTDVLGDVYQRDVQCIRPAHRPA